MSNLTLSIDDDLLKKARLYAVAHDTSVNAMVREFLKGIAEQARAEAVVIYSAASPESRRQAAAEVDELAEKIRREGRIDTDWQWRRDDAYADRLESRNRE